MKSEQEAGLDRCLELFEGFRGAVSYGLVPPQWGMFDKVQDFRQALQEAARMVVELGGEAKNLLKLSHSFTISTRGRKKMPQECAEIWYECWAIVEEARLKLSAGPTRQENEQTDNDIPDEYRDYGKASGEPLTVDYVSQPETYGLTGPYLSKKNLSTIKLGRKQVYLFSDITQLSTSKNQTK